MSRLNTMYPDDEFLKNISDMMGKLDNKNEREIKQEIEQIGYKEFYRYYKEKDIYIKQLKEKINGVYEERTYLYNKLSAEKEQLNSLVNSCQEEIRQLKKQLEEYKATNEVLSHELTKDKVLQQDCLTTCCGIPIGDIPKLITQQKEFIKYLKDMLDNENDIFSVVRVKDVLNKYKETIGVKDE